MHHSAIKITKTLINLLKISLNQPQKYREKNTKSLGKKEQLIFFVYASRADQTIKTKRVKKVTNDY